MARKVIWADAAVADLDAAAEFISKDSPAYAAAFVLIVSLRVPARLEACQKEVAYFRSLKEKISEKYLFIVTA